MFIGLPGALVAITPSSRPRPPLCAATPAFCCCAGRVTRGTGGSVVFRVDPPRSPPPPPVSPTSRRVVNLLFVPLLPTPRPCAPGQRLPGPWVLPPPPPPVLRCSLGSLPGAGGARLANRSGSCLLVGALLEPLVLLAVLAWSYVRCTLCRCIGDAGIKDGLAILVVKPCPPLLWPPGGVVTCVAFAAVAGPFVAMPPVAP